MSLAVSNLSKPSKPSKPSKRAQYGAAVPGWLWLLALVSVSAFVLFIGYMENYQTNKSTTTKINLRQQKPTSADPASTEKSTSTDFDFYSLLPEIEKIIPESVSVEKPLPKIDNGTIQPASIPTPSKGGMSSNTVATKRGYYLQAGSFKDFQAADSRRASLALIGFESQIQNANLPGRGLWHRVRIGPFATMSDMRKTRKRLKNNGIDSIMLTVKK